MALRSYDPPPGFGKCGSCPYRERAPVDLCYRCARREFEDLPPFDDRCKICDLPLESGETCQNILCKDERERVFGWNYSVAMRSGELEAAINRYKYDGKIGWGMVFARVLLGFLNRHRSTFSKFDLIAASATHSGREHDHTRTVLQWASEFDVGDWPFDTGDPPLVRKNEETPQMAGKTYRQRRTIANGALLKSLEVTDLVRARDKRILVYDDIFTCGLTLNAMAKALRQAGATAVCGVSLARQPWKK